MRWLDVIESINHVVWADWVLIGVLAVGVLFTLWSVVGQYRALTHGVAVIRGRYDDDRDPGAINHFQALSTALSATVGLGNIAGVAIAVSLGGPGAVLWMWVVGFVGMCLKMTEVIQAMLFRDTSDPSRPRGGAMWVCRNGFSRLHPALAPFGALLGGLFCVTLLVSAITGGNMFQAWNVADISHSYLGIPHIVSGIILTLATGVVIVGGIKRIGNVTGRLVPFMCGLYILAGLAVVAMNIEQVPGLLALIVRDAFAPSEAAGAFVGGSLGYAFLKGMQRALFSNEAGQGSAPIAHSAARTDEPVREGVVAGLEPFIDTLCVCTITALVILISGAWSREPALAFIGDSPRVIAVQDARPEAAQSPIPWLIEDAPVAPDSEAAVLLREGAQIFAVVRGTRNDETGSDHRRVPGRLVRSRDAWIATFDNRTDTERAAAAPAYSLLAPAPDVPLLAGAGAHLDYKGATLTAKAFDRALPGLGLWIVPATVWLFAISTIISWSYYGEQAVSYLFAGRGVGAYRVAYCLLILAAVQFVRTEHELDVLSTLGTGLMLWVNIPVMLIFGPMAMREYHAYFRRLRSGQARPPHAAPPVVDIIEDRDVS